MSIVIDIDLWAHISGVVGRMSVMCRDMSAVSVMSVNCEAINRQT
jgi:hypothetical protein